MRQPAPTPPRRSPSLEDVAQRAGVSTATVSRVLNSPEKVAPATAQRVRAAIAHLDYRPNQFAAGLMTRSSRVIGVIVPDDFAGVTPEILSRAEDEARRLGFHLLLISASRLAQPEDARAAPALGMLDAAVILIDRPNPALRHAAESLGVPVSAPDQHAPGKAPNPVSADTAAALFRKAMHAALDHD